MLAWRSRVPDWFRARRRRDACCSCANASRRRFNEIASQRATRGEQIVVVAHGGVLGPCSTGSRPDCPTTELQAPRTWTVENAAINRLLWTPGGLSLVGWADASHLEDGSDDDVGA